MDVKTQELERILEALSPALAAELNRVVEETREGLEREYQTSLQAAVQAAVHEAEAAGASKAQAEAERAVEEAKEQILSQVTSDLEQQFNTRLEAAKSEAAEERAKLEATLTEQMTRVAEERDQWLAFAHVQQQLAEASSQTEILSRFLKLAQPFAEGLALYVTKGQGLSLWKSGGKGAFPEIISKQTTDPESYFRTLSVRGQTVGAICATPKFKAEALEFLAGSLERAIEVYGLKLRAPAPKVVVTEKS